VDEATEKDSCWKVRFRAVCCGPNLKSVSIYDGWCWTAAARQQEGYHIAHGIIPNGLTRPA
jgi:hypothetical protein